MSGREIQGVREILLVRQDAFLHSLLGPGNCDNRGTAEGVLTTTAYNPRDLERAARIRSSVIQTGGKSCNLVYLPSYNALSRQRTASSKWKHSLETQNAAESQHAQQKRHVKSQSRNNVKKNRRKRQND